MVKPIDIPICKICLAKYSKHLDDGTRITALAADLNLVPSTDLIEAAPDLLEACRAALETMNMDVYINMCEANDYPDIKDKLYDAIKKAEGTK